MAETEAMRELDVADTLPSIRLPPDMRKAFPFPAPAWLDTPYDCLAQWESYEHVLPLKGARVLQLGGRGTHAMKFLLVGAAEAWLLTPMEGEARYATALAWGADLGERFRCVVGVAEELPFPDGSFDVVYACGTVHHMVTELAFPEIWRVMTPGGRFAAVEPWRAPLYGIGTRLLGQQEEDVFCRPLTSQRVQPLWKAFRHGRVSQHGTLTRYCLLALMKLGVSLSLKAVWRITTLDDRVASLFPRLRAHGSSVALLGRK